MNETLHFVSSVVCNNHLYSLRLLYPPPYKITPCELRGRREGGRGGRGGGRKEGRGRRERERERGKEGERGGEEVMISIYTHIHVLKNAIYVLISLLKYSWYSYYCLGINYHCLTTCHRHGYSHGMTCIN